MMHHTVITIDIASRQELDHDTIRDLIYGVTDVMDAHPMEFEDWKTTYHKEKREI